MKINLILSILLPLCAVSAAAEPPQPGLGKWWKSSEVVRDLQLSEGQVDRIEGIFLGFRPVLANLNKELQDREEGLRALMDREPVDDSKIQNQTELIALSRAALEKANSSMMLAIRKELSREQWSKLRAIRDSRRGIPRVMMAPPRGPEAESRSGQRDEKIYTVGGGVKAPMALYQPLPPYTEEAREAKVQGVMLLKAVIRKDGRATDVRVLRGLGYGLDERAVEFIAREWRFAPGTLDGQPVDIQANIELSFRLY